MPGSASNPPPLSGQTLPNGYAEVTSNITTTATFASPVDATGLSITVVPDGRPIIVEFYAPQVNNSVATERCVVRLRDGAAVEYASAAPISTAAGQPCPVQLKMRRTPPAGVSITYKVMHSNVASGNAVIEATATNRAFIRAYYDA